MNKRAITGFIFFGALIGLVAGVAASATCFRKKYEKEAAEEIEKARDEFEKKLAVVRNIRPVVKAREVKTPEEKSPEVKNAYSSLVRDYATVIMDDPVEEEEGTLYISDLTDVPFDEKKSEPYEIDPDDYGEREGYDMISYSCYSDGVITNEYDEALTDDEVKSSLGTSVRRRITEGKEPAIYIRNDNTKMDYEILADPQTYADVLFTKKYMADGENIMNAVTQTIIQEGE